MTTRSLFAIVILATAFAHGVPAAAATLQGEVLEVRDVEGYSYLRLKTADGETWAAVPTAAVKKGARVTLTDTLVMQNFESRALKRKFDRIVFASLADPAAKAAAPTPAPAAASAVKVAKAAGADARTVAEVIDGRNALKGKTVTVRGQVVKMNSGILGKTWIHLQDGSGKAAAGTHDLIVTTTDAAAVGDVVQASGTVRTDVTVGAGYAYAVLVEDAKLRK